VLLLARRAGDREAEKVRRSRSGWKKFQKLAQGEAVGGTISRYASQNGNSRLSIRGCVLRSRQTNPARAQLARWSILAALTESLRFRGGVWHVGTAGQHGCGPGDHRGGDLAANAGGAGLLLHIL